MGSFRERKSQHANVSINLGNLLSNYKMILATPSPTCESQGKNPLLPRSSLETLSRAWEWSWILLISAQINGVHLYFLLPLKP